MAFNDQAVRHVGYRHLIKNALPTRDSYLYPSRSGYRRYLSGYFGQGVRHCLLCIFQRIEHLGRFGSKHFQICSVITSSSQLTFLNGVRYSR